VHLEPAAVLVALATGGAIAGVVGAALAVPVTAVSVTVIVYLREQQHSARTARAAAAASAALDAPDTAPLDDDARAPDAAPA
jgi:predicted PurR-regulated permease PerM